MTGPGTITITRNAPRVMAGPRKAPFTAWVVPGRDGQGINYTDSVATYADLPTDLTDDDRGAGYFVVDDGLLYSWNGATFPAQGDGLPIQGEPGPQGRGITAGGVSVVGTQLRFLMNDGSTDAVTIPAIQQAIDSAAAASSSATAANTAKGAAEAAASTAGAAATIAVGARDAAQTARTGAEAARDTATTAATAADNSADAAALSATNADTSETNAANSAGAAATSATQADASADSADTARIAAVAAQTAAEGFSTAAGNSAAAAAGSADDAQDSATAAAASAAEAADVVASGIPNATDTAKGGIVLSGDLGGTWDKPTVPGLAGKADLDGNGKVVMSQIPAQALIHSHAATAITSGTLDVARLPVGTAAGTVAAGDDSRITGAVPNTRSVSAGTGLSGGGDLTTNRTLSVQYGTTAGTAAQGNDARLSDTRTPTDNTVGTAKIVDGAVTVAKLAAEVGTTIQGMIDTSVLAAQRITVNAQTGAYTLVLADANKAIEVTTASAVNLTIPTDASVAFPVGTVIEVDQLGAGKVTIVGASGVTVQAPQTPTTRAQWSAVVLRKRAANTWLVTGDLG